MAVYTISGNVGGVSSVIVAYTGSAAGSVVSDSLGNFTIPGLQPGAYTITPALSGYVFNPISTGVIIVSQNIAGVNFVSSRTSGLFRLNFWVKSVLGQALNGAQVFVCLQPANISNPPSPLATIYQDNAGLIPITQPIPTDGFGYAYAYTTSGLYTIVVVYNGVVQNFYPDQIIGYPQLASVTNNEGPLTPGAIIVGGPMGGSDITTGPVFPGIATEYLNGAGAFSTPPAGTVTGLSVGNLSPLFTASVATPNTTPALTFSLTNQSANLFLATPNGVSGAPSFRAIIPADVPVMVGDSGSGGVAGLVPAPAAGTAAALKYLKADGTWAVPAGSGIGLSSVGISTTATWLTVGNSPLIVNGTISINPTSGLTANQVLATPNGSTGVVSLRALAATDIPALSYTTSFSAGTLSPLFTTNVATATTTPALTFSLTNAATNSVFAGPATGAAGAPTYRALVTADMPVGTGTVTSFSCGALDSIATTNVATATTTPALTFSLSTQLANSVWAGPTTGSAASPTFRALVTADMPSRVASITAIVNGGSSTPPTGVFANITLPVSCTVTGWVITGDASGSAVVDVLLSTYAAFPTTASIAASDKPTLASVQKNENLNASTWSTALVAGDVLQFNLNSVTTCKVVSVTVLVTIP